MSPWKTILGGVPSTQNNVVSMEPRHKHEAPRKWLTAYKEASEQLEYLTALKAGLDEFERNEAERLALSKAERVQRAAAIVDAERRHDELLNEILVMAANVGLEIEGRQS